MARGSGGGPAYALWLAHAGRLIASNQRLLGFPIAIYVCDALLLAPVTLASRSDATFTEFAKDAVQPEKTIDDLLSAPLHGSVQAAVTLYIVGTVLTQAWLAGAFIASIRDGAVRWHPGWHAFANLVVLYAVTEALALALTGYADSRNGNSGIVLVAALATTWPLVYADYVVVMEGRNAASGVVRSLRLATHRWRETLSLLAVVNIVGVVVAGGLGQQITDADGVFPPFLGAVLCVNGLIRYCSDCAGIALVADEGAGQAAD
jgi:hypothetical protein